MGGLAEARPRDAKPPRIGLGHPKPQQSIFGTRALDLWPTATRRAEMTRRARAGSGRVLLKEEAKDYCEATSIHGLR